MISNSLAAPHLLDSSKYLWLVLCIRLKDKLLQGVMDGQYLRKLLFNLQQNSHVRRSRLEAETQQAAATSWNQIQVDRQENMCISIKGQKVTACKAVSSE